MLRNVANYLPKNTALPRKFKSSNEKAHEKDGVPVGHIAYGRDVKLSVFFLGGGAAHVQM